MTSCDLAKFDGLKKIGEGTYGVVFKGIHKRSGKQVALKKISLERNFSIPSRVYTHEVVTLWYRAPEILLGGRYYSTAIDVWSLGCIFSEMVSGSPLFAGDSEIDQLFRIFKILGTPTPEIWAGVEKLQDYKRSFPRWTYNEKALVAATSPMTEDGVDLLKEMLHYPPESRITAKSALGHRYLRDVVLQPPEVTPLLRPPASFTTTSPTGGTAEAHHQHDF
ncbi:hypothetical protein TELCIR_08228 [Teladorsagia circumcincta]|uniref:cyclin-dependent kinase n=1 Tax=Teladorsagia circumcincta TaxID=45464 RepID=A0A2G9UIC4_TELCI|nr:hypothetical protein TELCIR_08228 [Teladorsagia circumcincta]